MSRAETITKLPLDTWAQILGIYPVHFAGVVLAGGGFSCTSAWHQHSWQDFDSTSREEIAEAIARAESDIEHALGYRLIPTWEIEEWNASIRPVLPELFNLNARNLRGFHPTIETDWHWMISGGIREDTLIEAGAAIVYSNTRLPATYDNLATVTVAVAENFASDEIRVYYPGHTADERWRIRPVTVVVAALTATITFERHLAIDESFMTGFNLVDTGDSALRPAVGEADGDFLSTVDVYRVRNDPQQQITLQWEPGPTTCSCGGTGCVACAYSTQTGCLILRGDRRLSNVAFAPATWDSTLEQFDAAALAVARIPDSMRVWYYAGLRDESQASPIDTMDPDWARTVAIYSASMLDRTPCQCSTYWWDRWSQDMAFSDGAGELSSFNLPPRMLDNPFGTRRGAIYAWQRVRRSGAAIGRSASLIRHP